MRLATWSANSICTRVDRVLAFLEREDIDTLAMQEIKCRLDQFPAKPFGAAGYELVIHGFNQWNGVAITSRVGLDDAAVFSLGQSTWTTKLETESVVEVRVLGVMAGVVLDAVSVRPWDLCMPNGREFTHPHYTYKLDWLQVLRGDVAAWLEADPDLPLALVGDWNMTPRNEDVWDMSALEGATHVPELEREIFATLVRVGVREVVRERVINYTHWNYQKLHPPKNEGMHIDFVYISSALTGRIIDAATNRDERKGKGVSDHVLIVVEVNWGRGRWPYEWVSIGDPSPIVLTGPGSGH